jgi:hypothetical protein
MTEQEKFEEWIEQVKTQNPEILDLENDDRHSQNLIGWCWAAWQAALASATKGNSK